MAIFDLYSASLLLVMKRQRRGSLSPSQRSEQRASSCSELLLRRFRTIIHGYLLPLIWRLIAEVHLIPWLVRITKMSPGRPPVAAEGQAMRRWAILVTWERSKSRPNTA
jgi:hypothetical protein